MSVRLDRGAGYELNLDGTCGGREDILMPLSVTAASARAAWVMPVPLVDPYPLDAAELLGELDRLTARRAEYRDSWSPEISGGGALIGAVDVQGANGSGLDNWLSANGSPRPDGMGRRYAR